MMLLSVSQPTPFKPFTHSRWEFWVVLKCVSNWATVQQLPLTATAIIRAWAVLKEIKNGNFTFFLLCLAQEKPVEGFVWTATMGIFFRCWGKNCRVLNPTDFHERQHLSQMTWCSLSANCFWGGKFWLFSSCQSTSPAVQCCKCAAFQSYGS